MLYFFLFMISSLFCCSIGMIDSSAMVEVSPRSGSLAAILRRMRRIILPERVFGR